MESLQRTTKSQWTILLTVALAASVLGFSLSYQDEQTRFSQMSLLAEAHLIYALQLKDDMALIDWSKSLENLPSVLAFQAHSGSTVVAEGGNKEMCPVVSGDSFSFDFPYRWIVHSTFNKDSVTPADLTMVFQDFHGPLLWSLYFFLVSFVSGFLLLRLKVAPKAIQSSSVQIVPTVKNTEAARTFVSMIDEKNPTLALDADYMISQATPLAAKALDRSMSDLVGSHFLDLLPDPSVMKVIAEAKETSLLKPFPSHPHLSVLIRPLPEGTILILQNENRAESL
jgi:hypothetical protein